MRYHVRVYDQTPNNVIPDPGFSRHFDSSGGGEDYSLGQARNSAASHCLKPGRVAIITDEQGRFVDLRLSKTTDTTDTREAEHMFDPHETLEVPAEVLEALVALSGTGQYGTPQQRRLLSDAVDLLSTRSLQNATPVGSAPSGAPEQLALFDASTYEQ